LRNYAKKDACEWEKKGVDSITMTLYETIFVRRSVRRYDRAPLNGMVLSEIQQALDNVKQLPGQSAHFEIVGAETFKGGVAPHAILAYSKDSTIALTNIGYTLQGMELYLQGNGYGSVWSMAGPKERREDCRILMLFGKTDVPLRISEIDVRRKSVWDISNEDNAVARAARLAPSAFNFQPWKLAFSKKGVTVQSNTRTLGKLLASNTQMMIILRHVELALEHEGKIITAFIPTGNAKPFAIEVAFEGNRKPI
jgi:hypothetical protein